MSTPMRESARGPIPLLLALATGALALAACEDTPGSTGPEPTPVVSTVTVHPGAVTLQVGDTLTLRAVARDAEGDSLARPITWTSERPAGVYVDARGRITGMEPGIVRVTATAGSRSGFATVTVQAPPEPPAPVITALDPSEVYAGGPPRVVHVLGTGFRPNARVRLDGQTRISEFVSPTELRVALPAEDVAQVGEAGMVVINPDDGRVSAPATFRVVTQPRPVAALAVHPALSYTNVGAAVPLAATAQDSEGAPAENRYVTYSSSNHLVATVDAQGVVHPLGIGRVTITARSEGIETTAVVEVRAGERHGLVASDSMGLVSLDLRLGTPPLRFWEHGPHIRTHSPSRSPDGRYVAYVHESGWHTHVAILDVAQRTYTFVPDAAFAADPAWSPAGDRIAFGALVGARSHVFTVRPDGTGLLDLTADLPEGVSAGDPAWSPDGSRLVYSVDGPAGQQGLMIMNADGTGKRYLTVAAPDFDPEWLGDVVVFTRYEAGGAGTNVWRVSVSGFGPLVRLTDSGRAHSPTLSPDHRWIAYIDGAEGEAGVLRVTTAFGEETRTLFEPGEGQAGLVDPTWFVIR
jgi:hypothetical protein